MDQTRIDDLRNRLESERAGIERQLAEYGASAQEEGIALEVDEGFADSAQATAERAEILGHVEQLHSTYAEIQAALGRIDDGSYGKCQRCGREIPAERLEARPTARLCVECQENASTR